MKCPICGDEFTPKRSDAKTCGKPACRKAYQRLGTITEDPTPVPQKEPVVVEKSPPTQEKEPEKHGHWIGKAPHVPIFSSCARENCPHQNNPEPNWTPTCQLACCRNQ